MDHCGKCNHFSFHFRILLSPSSVLQQNLYCQQMTNELHLTLSFSMMLGHSIHHIFIALVKWLVSWRSESTGWFPVLKAQIHSNRLGSLLFLSQNSGTIMTSPFSLSYILHTVHSYTNTHTHINIFAWGLWLFQILMEAIPIPTVRFGYMATCKDVKSWIIVV